MEIKKELKLPQQKKNFFVAGKIFLWDNYTATF